MNLNLNGGSRADRKMSLVLANFNDFAETIEKPLDQEPFRFAPNNAHGKVCVEQRATGVQTNSDETQIMCAENVCRKPRSW